HDELYKSFKKYSSQGLLTSIMKEKEEGSLGGFIVAGSNYGQGSSREHAALVPLYLGIKAVLAKSFARIHRDNLLNNGILPLVFENESDYDKFSQGDEIELCYPRAEIKAGNRITVKNKTKGLAVTVILDLSPRLKDIVLNGGVLADIAMRNGQ
ncbi:MAG: aconitate hydratase, partial [Firmicutes bacterium]|nr:aconitate hydratase [Bacillota bacterium]